MIVSETAVQAMRIAWVGIDVSKKTLDAAIWAGGKSYRTRKVDNTGKGVVALLEWSRVTSGEEVELRFCMESTGDYYAEPALFLTEAGFHVSVMNPARIKYFGMELGRLTKTDKADAKLIAQFASERRPPAWPMRDETQRKLFRLNRRRQQLVKMISMEDSRRECPEAIGEFCLASIKRILRVLRSELREVEAAIAKLLSETERFKEKADLIGSISVLGQVSIATILAEMPPIEEVSSAASYASAAGVQPTLRQSGERQPISAPMSKSGRRAVRKALFMPTLTGIRDMPELKALYERLIAKGKHHYQAMVACIRKLLMIVYGVLKHKTPYKPRVPEARVNQAA